MIWLRLALANLSLSPLASAVNVLLMALGTASIVLLLLAGARFTDTLSRDARGVDLVVGAGGSPMQLILSAVYHADIPPGNIPLREAQVLAEDSRVALAAPLALGDSYRGYRIVGTTPAFFELFALRLAQGGLGSQPMDAIIGAAVARETGFGPGDRFSGAHGFSDGGPAHDARPYRVAGVLARTGTVADRLILTDLESVWSLHDEDHDHDEPEATNDTHEHDDDAALMDSPGSPGQQSVDPDREITAILLRYRTPLAAMTMPREINTRGTLQAASPPVEIARMLSLVGLGLDGLRTFAWALIATACLSVFAALYGSLRSRRRDLAMLRCLGATRAEVFVSMLSEGLLLSMVGIALGYLLGHGAMLLLSVWLESSRGVALSGLQWAPGEGGLLMVLMVVSVLSAAIPAVEAYRTDVARTLAEGGV